MLFRSYNKDWTYDKQTGIISCGLSSLEAGKTAIKRFEIKVSQINNETYEDIINNMALVKAENGVEYASNVYESTANKAYWKINMKSEHNETLKELDEVKYIINVTNIGKRFGSFKLFDEIPEEIRARTLAYYYGNNEENKKVIELDSNTIDTNVGLGVNVGETIVIEIEGKVKKSSDTSTTKKITNIAKIPLGDNKYIESNAITNTIIKEDNNSGDNNPGGNNPGENNPGGNNPGENNPGDNNPGGNNPGENNPGGNNPGGNENDRYYISGTVWLDKNRDGIRTSDEEVLQSQKIVLLDEEGNI